MVKATGKLRTFDVELTEPGGASRVIATGVPIDVARSMSRQSVGPDRQAVVRPRDPDPGSPDDEGPKYAIWLWNEQKMCWERLFRHQQLSLAEAADWLRRQSAVLGDRLTLLAPAHLKHPL